MTLKQIVGCAMLVAALGALVIGALWGNVAEHGHSVCLFKYMTTLPCPFCGMTRATMELGAGNISAAWGYNPMIFIVLPGYIAIASRWTFAGNQSAAAA